MELAAHGMLLRGVSKFPLMRDEEIELFCPYECQRPPIRRGVRVSARIERGTNCVIGFASEAEAEAFRETLAEAIAAADPARSEFRAKLELATPTVVVTYALLAANVAAFAWGCWRGMDPILPTSAQLVAVGADFGLYTLRGEWWRLGSAMFTHIGLVHLALNMLALWSFGRLVERLYGRSCIALIYLTAGVGGNLASLWWDPSKVSAGASGAIYGVVGAMLAWTVTRGAADGGAYRRVLKGQALTALLLNFVYAAAMPRIDHAAHMGGLLTGLAVGAASARPLEPQARRRALRRALAAGALVAAVMLGAGLARLRFGPEHRFVAFWGEMSERGDKATEVETAATQEAAGASGQISGRRADLVRHVESGAVAEWSALEKTCLAVGLAPETPWRTYWSSALGYVRGRRDAAVILTHALGQPGPPDLNAYETAMAETVRRYKRGMAGRMGGDD